MAEEFPSAVSEMPVANVDEAARYYEECLGFTKAGAATKAELVRFPGEAAESS